MIFLLFKPIYFDFTRRSNVFPYKVLYDHVPPILSQYKSVLDDKFKAWAACARIYSNRSADRTPLKFQIILPRTAFELSFPGFLYVFPPCFSWQLLCPGLMLSCLTLLSAKQYFWHIKMFVSFHNSEHVTGPCMKARLKNFCLRITQTDLDICWNMSLLASLAAKRHFHFVPTLTFPIAQCTDCGDTSTH